MFDDFKKDLQDFCERTTSPAVRFSVEDVPVGLCLNIEYQTTVCVFFEVIGETIHVDFATGASLNFKPTIELRNWATTNELMKDNFFIAAAEAAIRDNELYTGFGFAVGVVNGHCYHLLDESSMMVGIFAALAYSGMIGTLSTSHTSDGIEYTLECAMLDYGLSQAEYCTVEFAAIRNGDGVKLKLPSGEYQELRDDTILASTLHTLLTNKV